jgi:Xaa-Pro dipeptidase
VAIWCQKQLVNTASLTEAPTTFPMTMTSATTQPLFDPDRVHTALEDADIDALVGNTKRNFYYLSGFDSLDYLIEPEVTHFAAVFRDPSQPAVVTLPMSERMELLGNPVWVPKKIFTGRFYIHEEVENSYQEAPSAHEALADALVEAGLSGGKIGMELDAVTASVKSWLRERLPKAEFVDAAPVFQRLRMIKTTEEIRRIRIACQGTEQAMEAARSALKPGMSEREVSHVVKCELTARDLDPLYAQVGTGESAGLNGPSDRVIARDDVVRLDVAGIYRNYVSDLGRGCVAGDATPQQRAYYEVAWAALEAGITAVKVGAPLSSIYDHAMAVWHDAGYPQVLRHHVGHSIGLQAHEPAMIKQDTATEVEVGMVLAIEVPCYVYGVGGFAPEDVVVVHADRVERVTQAPEVLPQAG